MTSPIFKCLIYVLIAALTSLTTEISNISNIQDISYSKWVCIFANIVLQSLIAVRAFIDQSLTNTQTSISSQDTEAP